VPRRHRDVKQMQVYLPIAGISVNALLILGMGGLVGFMSGLFGVGGGFLITPLLIVTGISPAVAVATGANQVVASSASAVLAHWRRGNVDFKMGAVLLLGGLAGSGAGVALYTWLRAAGNLDTAVGIAYVLLLGTVGGMMLVESVRTMLRRTRPTARRKLHQHTWLHGLPLKARFPRSRLYISMLLPFAIGLGVGVLTAIMGVGGGFIMVPAMIYLLGMPTGVAVGTSLFQIIFVTANVTFLQSVGNQTVDVVLAALLLAGGVVGAQFGSRLAWRLRGEQLRGLLALIVLAVGLEISVELVAKPGDLFSIAGAPGGE
jgi:uncharacterized membrane protein YfcA